MSQKPKRSARDRAVDILVDCYDGECFGLDLLAEMQDRSPLSPADAALAAQLVQGVAQHRITAEHLAARYYRKRWVGLRTSLRVILATAVYQLCWLDRIPDHAAVDQAVSQAKRRGRAAANTVNAVLRKLISHRGDVIERPTDPAPDPRRYLPLDTSRGRLFDENVFPDPERRPLEHIIAVTGHPAWIVERWHRRYKPALCREICDASGRRPPLVLRPNRLRTTPDALAQSLSDAGFPARRLDDSDAILLPSGTAVEEIPAFQQGLCQPQDSTAQIAVTLAAPAPGEIVLDLCAGVGTKSTQAAEWMKNDGVVIASDTDGMKLTKIPTAAERLGIDIVRPTLAVDLPEALAKLDRKPDVILLDVPCSNSGVFARRPEARYRASHRALIDLTGIQQELLEQAHALAGPKTRLVYSTCSLEEEENAQQVEAFCRAHSEWRIEHQTLTTPNADRDGGFAAVLQK